MTKIPFSQKARFSKSKLALAIAAHMLAMGNVLAAPAGGEIVGGTGSIEQQGTETTIVQESDRLAIDWQNFDVGTNERVEFVQPGQSAVALNRILGNKGSEILGRIDANGHVILVNPRGVLFGEGAVVNAGGLIASGLQINPEDFMNGDLVFKRIEGTDGTVINSGMINAAAGGNVALLGAQVENRGLISAKLGSVILASGREAVLTFDESGLLGVQVDEVILQEVLGEIAAVKNSGEIFAENGRVLLSATTTRDVFSKAVNWGDQQQARSVTYNEDGSFILGAGGNVENSGTLNVSGKDSAGIVVAVAENVTHTGLIHSDALQGHGGDVELHSNSTTLVAEEGVVTASGTEGGDIKLLGKNVGLFEQAAVEATGESGGGRILMGGDREGLSPEIRNADFVYVGKEASIDTSATNLGDGGITIVFAEDTARVYGSLSARAGENGGDGGFVETSGKMGFEIIGSPDVSAAKGSAGHWLIDPFNLVIEQASTRSIDDETQANHFISEASNARLDTEDLQEALNAGATITVKTGSASSGQGNIIVSSEINLTSNVTSTLNLIAHNNITINANITSGQKSSGRKLNLHLNANTSNNQGSITFGNNVRIETGGGDFKVGRIAQDGSIDVANVGAYNVDFSNVIIDVMGAPYEDILDTTSPPANDTLFDRYFGNRSPAVEDDYRQYLSDSGRILVNASNDVNLGGSNGSGGGTQNGAVTMFVRGRERAENSEKIHIIAGRDVLLSSGRVWTYDNNSTENLGNEQSPYDGYTTLKLEAGRNIDLAGNIIYAFNQVTGDARQEQTDRLMIDLSAEGNINIDGNLYTAGGHFIVRDAVDVDFSGQTIDTGSRYGAGNVSITASDDITLGSLPMFGQSVAAGSLRNPSLTAIAGDTLNIGSSDFYTRGGNIELGAARWNFNGRRLETRDGGDIIFTTAGAFTLPTVISSRNVTLNSKNADDVFDVEAGSGGLQLNGLLTLDLKSASAEIANITNASTAAAANLVITSAQDVTLQTNEAIRLGDSVVSGDLALASGAGITQQAATHVTVEGTSEFRVNNGSVILNQAENIFTGAVWVGGTAVQNADLYSAQDLILGDAGSEMILAGTLAARAGENLEQVGVIAVTGATTLAAEENITLGGANRFSSLAIEEAASAVVRNVQNLALGAVRDLASLDLSVTGNLTQSAALDLDELILDVTGAANLTQTTNQIANLSGEVASGEIAATGSLLLGNFEITGNQTFALRLGGNDAQLTQAADATFITSADTAISAARAEVNSQIQLQGGADLTFENLVEFVLRGDLQGTDADDNSVTVNGTSGSGTYEIHADATWADVSLSLDGGTGADTLRGPDLAATWHIEAAEPHTLETAQGQAQFRGMETLQGGNQVDNFAFATGAVTTLALNGGAGADVADYSGMTGNINVPLGAGAGLSSVERIRGNNDGTGTTNSALTAQGNTANVWVVSAVNAGQVTPAGGTAMAFEGFNQLVGGGGQDNFTFSANLSGGSPQADGAGGDDIFNVLAEITANLIGGEGADRFNLQAATFGGLSGGNGNDTFVLTDDARVASLDGGTGLNTLVGFDADLLWSINTTPIFGGAVRVQVTDAVGTVVVEGARNLTGLLGGAANDTFLFGLNNSGLGADGGEGDNTADFSEIVGDLTVNLGELDQLGLSNIGDVVGNAQLLLPGTSTLGVVSAGANCWTLSSPDSGAVQLAGGDTIAFRNFNNFQGGPGADRFDISAAPAGPIDGRGGDDSFYLLAPDIAADLIGGEGSDTLVAHQNEANFWTLQTTGSNLRREGPLTPELIAASVEFGGMEVLRGAENFADTFAFLSLANPQPTITAGDGAATDTIDYSGLANQTVGVTLGSAGLTGFERVLGNGNTSTLTGANQNSNWRLDGQGGGQVTWSGQTTAFSGFGQWVGGTANDNFSLLTLTGAPASISGGAGTGTDTLDLSALMIGLDIGAGLAAGRPLNITGIETLTANAAQTNTLTSGAAQSDWRINIRNGGSLTGDAGTPLAFTGFQQLRGLQANRFVLAEGGSLALGEGAGLLIGGTGVNELRVEAAGAHIWTLGGGLGSLARAGTVQLNFAGINALTGGAGDDAFVLTSPSATVADIDGGSGVNSLQADWNSPDTLQWRVVNGVGELVGRVTEFVGIQRLIGQAGRDDFQLSGNTNLTAIDSGAGDDQVSLSGSASVTRLNTGEGSDTISLTGSATITDPIDGGTQPAGGGDHLDLSGYGSALVWNIANNRIGNFGYTNVERISAPDNFDNTLQGPDLDTLWTIRGENQGSFQSGGGPVFDFAGISQLLGGSQADTFLLAGGSVSGSLDGGAGANSLRGNNAVNQWTLSGADSGLLASTAGGVADFLRIQTLLGGSGEDRFVIQTGGSLSGNLDGGAGAAVDTLQSTRSEQTWTLTHDALSRLTNRDGSSALNFTGIEELQATGQDHLAGTDRDSLWRVTANGAGQITRTAEDDLDSGTIGFSGFSALLGGAGADVFEVGAIGWIGDSLDGGGGVNALSIERPAAVRVNLDATQRPDQSLTALRLQTIEVKNTAINSLLGAGTAEGGYSWGVDGANTGTVAPTLDPTEGSAVRFINFANLLAGGRSDLFRIDSEGVLMAVDGGGGDDFLDYSAFEGNLDITVGGDLGEQENFRIDSIEGLVGNQDGSGTSPWRASLKAAGGTNTWTLSAGADATQDGINDGVFTSNDPGVEPMVFRNFSHLQGGSGADTFILVGQGMLTGAITDSGGSNNRLDLSGISDDRALKVALYTTEPGARAGEDTLLVQGLQTLRGAGSATTLIGADTATQWQVNGADLGQLSYGAINVTFSDFGHLLGGALGDIFTFGPAGSLSGWLAGGGGSDQLVFSGQSQQRLWLAGAEGLGPDDGQVWRLVRRDIELIAAPANSASRLQLESDAASEWRITGANQGALGQVAFTGFSRITGGAGNDNFIFAAGGGLTGLLDGGRGENSLDLRALTVPVTVSDGRRRDGADLGITRIQAVQANPLNAANRLWADGRDNRWSITGQNSGTLNSETSRLNFSGFGNLTGGALNDHFEFVAAGDISGQLDGGDHSTGDTVDYRARTSALVIDLRGQPRLRNIETLIGNEQTTLMGPDQNAEWRVTGLDAGQLVYGADQEAQMLNFSGVGHLAGGFARDEFVFSGGALSGGAEGGAGDDRFVLQLQAGSLSRLTRLAGGADTDSLLVEGGGANWSGVYSLDTGGQPQLAFRAGPVAEGGAQTDTGAVVSYRGLESALVTAELASVKLQASPATEVVQLAGTYWQLDEDLPVVYRSGVAGLEVEAGTETTIQISGALNLSGNLSLTGGTVTAESGASVAAAELSLLEVLGVGAADAPLALAVNRLRVSGGRGPLYLREADSLDLAGLQGGGGLDLVLQSGTLTQSAAIVTDAPISLVAEGGSVHLGHSGNLIKGGVHLSAAADAQLYNGLDTRLTGVQARNLTLEAVGSITSDAALVVTDTSRFTSTGDLVLTSADNRLERVFLSSGGAVSLVNSGALTLLDTQVAGHLEVQAETLDFSGDVSAASLTGTAGAGGLNIPGTLAVAGEVGLDSAGIVLMGGAGSIRSAAGNITLSSEDTQALGLLAAPEGEVRLNSGRAIVDVNDGATTALNIEAQKLYARAVSGIGVFNPLELAVASLDLVNQSGSVALANTGPLTVERLRNGGDITLRNSTDVTLKKQSVNAFFGTEEPQYPEDKFNPGMEPRFELELTSGSIKTDGSLVFTQPHIAAFSVNIINPHGAFLPPSPVIYAPGEVVITIGRSRSRPSWGFGVVPDKVTDDTSYYGDVVGAGEQLIEVETLADIDPAVFTPVKNYFYQEVSIRLPSDQLYEEE